LPFPLDFGEEALRALVAGSVALQWREGMQRLGRGAAHRVREAVHPAPVANRDAGLRPCNSHDGVGGSRSRAWPPNAIGVPSSITSAKA
jgi:hypothetical protein